MKRHSVTLRVLQNGTAHCKLARSTPGGSFAAPSSRRRSATGLALSIGTPAKGVRKAELAI